MAVPPQYVIGQEIDEQTGADERSPSGRGSLGPGRSGLHGQVATALHGREEGGDRCRERVQHRLRIALVASPESSMILRQMEF